MVNSLLLLTAPSREGTKVSVTGLMIRTPLRQAQHSKSRAVGWGPFLTVWKPLWKHKLTWDQLEKNVKGGLWIRREPGWYPKGWLGSFPGSWQAKDIFAEYLDKAERGPWGQDDVLIGELILHILFQTLFFVDFPAIHHVEECPGRDSDGDGMLRFGLQRGTPTGAQSHRPEGIRNGACLWAEWQENTWATAWTAGRQPRAGTSRGWRGQIWGGEAEDWKGLPYTEERKEAGRGSGCGAARRGARGTMATGPAHRPGARAAWGLLIQHLHGWPVGFVVVLLFSLPEHVGHTVAVLLGWIECPTLGIGLPFGGGRALIFPGLLRVPGVPDVPYDAVSPGFGILMHLGAAPGPILGLGLRGRGRTRVERHGRCGRWGLCRQLLWQLLLAKGGGWSPGGRGAIGELGQDSRDLSSMFAEGPSPHLCPAGVKELSTSLCSMPSP